MEPCKSIRFESQVTEGGLTFVDIIVKIEEVVKNQKKTELGFRTSFENLYGKMEENTKNVKKQAKVIAKCLKLIDDLGSEKGNRRKRSTV